MKINIRRINKGKKKGYIRMEREKKYGLNDR